MVAERQCLERDNADGAAAPSLACHAIVGPVFAWPTFSAPSVGAESSKNCGRRGSSGRASCRARDQPRRRATEDNAGRPPRPSPEKSGERNRASYSCCATLGEVRFRGNLRDRFPRDFVPTGAASALAHRDAGNLRWRLRPDEVRCDTAIGVTSTMYDRTANIRLRRREAVSGARR